MAIDYFKKIISLDYMGLHGNIGYANPVSVICIMHADIITFIKYQTPSKKNESKHAR
jgi:hypothetical protein